MVRAGRVSRGWANALITLSDEVIVAEIFVFSETPFVSSLLMHFLRERFCEAVSDGLNHDRIVVIMILVILFTKLIDSVPHGHSEATEVIGFFRARRGDEVGKGVVGGSRALGGLLPECVERRYSRVTVFSTIYLQIVARTIAWEESVDDFRLQEFLRDDEWRAFCNHN